MYSKRLPNTFGQLNHIESYPNFSWSKNRNR
jgi:hypothetical protein